MKTIRRISETKPNDELNPNPFEDTIAAVSSPAGRGAVGLVRISGTNTLPLLEKHCRIKTSFRPPLFAENGRRMFHCLILNGDESVLDDGVAAFFKGPHSYTGEDTAEIFLHGNPILLHKLVTELTLQSGVRPADPGEFTRRAFWNGKMDLTQAESVRRIIEAKNEYELEAGKKILEGEISRMTDHFRSALVLLKAETEAEVDFSTEDLTFQTKARRQEIVQQLIEELGAIQERSKSTARIAGGFQIALAGVPNAGKSSLLNRMLGWDRAIVSPLPGTTRDFVSEEISIDGVSVRLIDTAGIRKAEDVIEEEGVLKSKNEIQRSHIILHIIDGSLPPYQSPDLPGAGTVMNVINKRDELHSSYRETAAEGSAVLISCLTGEGLEELRTAVRNEIFQGPGVSDPLLLEERHLYHFSKIQKALEKTMILWSENAPAEIVAIELDEAIEHTGEITGRITNEEILGKIFSTFCIGK